MRNSKAFVCGADAHFAEILALNCRTEILPGSLFNNSERQFSKPIQAMRVTLDALGGMGIDELRKMLDLGECTAIAVSPESSADGHCWLAQNWDWLGCQRAALVVLHTIDSHGTPIATLTEAGMLAKIGLNAFGCGNAFGGTRVDGYLTGARCFNSSSQLRTTL